MPSFALVQLGSITTFAGGAAFPHAEQGRTEGDYPFLKVGDMNAPGNEREMLTSENWIDEQQRVRLRARVWPAGTVIFPKVGAALKTEKRRLLTRTSAFDNNVMGLVPGDSVLPRFLLAVMEGVRLGAFAQEGVVPSINQQLVSTIEVPLPSLDVQSVIVDLLVAADTVADAARAHASTAASMRAALSRALLAGDHDLPVRTASDDKVAA
jgi:type I restriction enzyme, S subunit